ncbi:hypothetical protein AYO44_16010 [Planctomycetaceae bacterium SCGC AG-212-F19]|nr:hypothetical protein AYO44_16010 [Planctomycetaceae bacterium SCGC AG-212-F19]
MLKHPACQAFVASLALVLAASPALAQNVNVVSPDGKLVAQSDGAVIRLKDAATQKDVAAIQAHTGAVTALAFSPDGKLLASGGQDKTIRLFDALTGKALRRLEGHQAGVTAVKFSADGKSLTSTDANQKTHSWDLATGKQLQ